MAQGGNPWRPVSKISSEDGSESFFKTAMRIELETAEDTMKRVSTDTPAIRVGIPEEATENDDFKMPVVSTKSYHLTKGIPLFQVRSPSPRAVSPDRLTSPFFQRTRMNRELENPDPVLDLNKALTMNRIAKTLVSNQKTRLQRLEETGNVTINSPLKQFNPNLVKSHLYKILKDNLKDIRYDPKLCLPLSKSLSEKTRDAVKALKFPRYKFVSVVTIGQLQSSTISICSRSLWNCTTDNYACAEYRNGTIYAVAMIYATFLD
ncbi:dynein light chain Tctex-type 5-like [Saccostrea echinata]|uniref:dynein light chain Tctex-type 5-like n=1 Tax=Saccostrea echinata TaxID=191078 RepID=UPI002A7EB6B5|nr:dynein light chain Tctex-type 5-like [Saccostrea echinata]